MSAALHLQAITFTASAPVLRGAKPIGIGFIVRMAAWTVGFGRLKGVVVCKPSIDVDLVAHRLQVHRVDARRGTAEMVKVQSFRNWANEPLIGQPMSVDLAILNARPECKNPVSKTIMARCPKPAAIRRVLVHLFPETLFGWTGNARHAVSIA